jgi:hypothetical protein
MSDALEKTFVVSWLTLGLFFVMILASIFVYSQFLAVADTVDRYLFVAFYAAVTISSALSAKLPGYDYLGYFFVLVTVGLQMYIDSRARHKQIPEMLAYNLLFYAWAASYTADIIAHELKPGRETKAPLHRKAVNLLLTAAKHRK